LGIKPGPKAEKIKMGGETSLTQTGNAPKTNGCEC